MLVILQVNNCAYDIALAIPRGPGYKPKREAGEPDCVMRTQALDFPLVFRLSIKSECSCACISIFSSETLWYGYSGKVVKQCKYRYGIG